MQRFVRRLGTSRGSPDAGDHTLSRRHVCFVVFSEFFKHHKFLAPHAEYAEQDHSKPVGRSCQPIGNSQGLAERALLSAAAGHWLTPDALVVVEEATDAAFAAPDAYEEIERRGYGDSELVFLRVKGGSA